MSSAHGGRRRPLTRTTSSSEDQALNQIAREAEARLAAKRAARAEARSIRLKELERQQQEGENVDDDDQSINDEPPIPPARKQKTPVARSISTGSSGISTTSKDQNMDMNGPLVPEKVLKSIQDNLKETEEKYRKAMVSIAQLDNEKQALLYQVDCLKDRLAEEEEISGEVKAEFKEKTKECSKYQKTIKGNEEEIKRLNEAIEFRDNFLAERGLSLYEDQELKDYEEGEASTVSLRDAISLAVPDETSSDRSSVSEPPKSRSNSRRPSLSDEKDVLVLQIKNLQAEVVSLKREDTETPKAITADLEELRREFSRQINDYKIKLQKAEQDNARLEGLVARVESQVKRYKTQAEAAEATEDSLKAEKRKLQRELRKAQDEIGELQTVNDHLQKRFDKLKSKRKDDT